MTEEKKAKTEEIPNEEPQELSLESLDERIKEMVKVLNNIIMYCNTIEKWRTMSFKPAPKEPENSDNVISDEEEQK
jgi:hypothetical protein